MEIKRVSTSTTGTTRPTNMLTEERGNCSAVQAKRSCCEHGKETPALCGESSKMIPVKQELTARCSATSQPTLVANSYVKRMRLLIAAGLVKGIIPTSKRKGSNQQTLDAVLRLPAGRDAERQR